MVETLDEKIKEAEQKIIATKSKYERLAMMLKDYAIMLSTYVEIEKIDKGSIPLLWDLIETMESIPYLNINVKTTILYYILHVAIYAESHPDHREEIIKNLREGIKILTNKEGLLKMNELYYFISERLRKIEESYRLLIEETPLQRNQKAKIINLWPKIVYDYYYEHFDIIIEGLLREPTKYEPLYKQLIETNDLREFFEYLQKEYENLRLKKT
ncbi:hypothetical protein DDW05_03100 [Candidatus Nanobsidianus stetteri]|uniref:Uncharacterized protein n=1 Tax=Nanobsidianus stetteri TaxID=1294122 RepID=A0A2T9WQE3_NANST|nr:hypothetical protein DDW05_03100 [Candidatus Nanobsidianus stetteri]